MTAKEQSIEKQYATIYELKLHEATLITSQPIIGKNDFKVWSREYLITRVHGGWIYSSRIIGNTPAEHFVPDTRHIGEQFNANRPRE